jgi:branched-chain amino acid transport system ATP-binding protein
MTALLELDGVRVSLAGSAILHGVGFTVAGSGVTALLGRNGVGKTTTARAIMGLCRSTGSIRFGDRELTGLATHVIASLGIGYVPEDRGVFSGLTVAENLRLAEPRPTAARREFVRDLFPVLDLRAAQPAGTLSGGEQQMLALARVLLRRQRLLLVDEPTKGLAPRVALEVAAALKRIAQEVPVLLVEQNLTLVRRAARAAIVLDNGLVAYTGDARELLGDPDLANRLLGVSSRSAAAAPSAATSAAPGAATRGASA